MDIPTNVKKNNGYFQVADKTFGHWTVIGYGGLDRRNNSLALCKCQCGTEKPVKVALLKNGRSESCGCKRGVTHGMSGTPEHWAWKNIRQRCYNTGRADYERYGGAGTRACKGWLNSFESFIHDMGLRPPDKTSIDRIDFNLHYSCGHCEECLENKWPMNCRWADADIQNNNSKKNIFLELNGKRMTAAQWSRELGFGPLVLIKRLRRGWSEEKALTTPLRAW